MYVPNPAIFTESSPFKASRIVFVIVSKVRSASALLRFKEPESCAISCFIFLELNNHLKSILIMKITTYWGIILSNTNKKLDL